MDLVTKEEVALLRPRSVPAKGEVKVLSIIPFSVML